MQDLEVKAEEDKQTFIEMLDNAYERAPMSQPSAMNTVRHALQKKVISWDNEFTVFEQKYIASDIERAKRMTSTHLRRLFDPSSTVSYLADARLSCGLRVARRI